MKFGFFIPLGIIEMVCSLPPSEEHIGGCEQIRGLASSGAKISPIDSVAPAHPVRLSVRKLISAKKNLKTEKKLELEMRKKD